VPSKKTKKSKKKTSRSLLSPARLARLQPFIFVAAFAAIGAAYLLATHASPTLSINLNTANTSGQPINGVYVRVESDPVGGCKPFNGTSNPKLTFYCTGDFASVTTISLSGYHVCPCSPVKVGTGWKTDQPKGVYGNIVMEADPAPAPPPANPSPPAPTPSPAPAPTSPSAPKSGNGSGSTTHVSTPAKTASPLNVGTSNSSIADSSTTNPQATSDATDQTATDNSNSTDSNANPNVLGDSSSTVTSSDNLVSVTFPAGTFDTDAYCSIDTGDSSNVPVKSASNIGPYSIDCTDSSGNPLNDLKKSVSVAITLPAGKSGYLAYVNDTNWAKVASTNNGKTLSFKLAKAQLFAAAPKKSSHLGSIILNVIGAIVLLTIVGGGLYIYHRRQNPYA
jgi:hypothetical protein